MGGFPVSNSASRTALGRAQQSHTDSYRLVTVAVIVLAVLIAGPLFREFPLAALVKSGASCKCVAG